MCWVVVFALFVFMPALLCVFYATLCSVNKDLYVNTAPAVVSLCHCKVNILPHKAALNHGMPTWTVYVDDVTPLPSPNNIKTRLGIEYLLAGAETRQDDPKKKRCTGHEPNFPHGFENISAYF